VNDEPPQPRMPDIPAMPVVDGGQGWATAPMAPAIPPMAPEPTPKRRHPLAILVAIIALIAIIGGAIVAVSSKKSPPGRPGAPTALKASATTCAPPRCKQITSTVTLTWSAPSTGSPVTGYRIFRDGNSMSDVLKAGTTTFDDTRVLLGKHYSYEVLANSAVGDSKRSEPASASIPLPPLVQAQLSETYSVTLKVTSATFLSEVEGIKDPKPGDTKRESWSFERTCGPDGGACPVKWYSLAPPLKPRGLVYSGTVRDKGARCSLGSTIERPPVYRSFHLIVTRAKIVGADWIVDEFKGTYTVSFSCSGGVASRATFSVKGVIGHSANSV
jgi:hypothetical protein